MNDYDHRKGYPTTVDADKAREEFNLGILQVYVMQRIYKEKLVITQDVIKWHLAKQNAVKKYPVYASLNATEKELLLTEIITKLTIS